MAGSGKKLELRYKFTFPNGRVKEFTVRFDDATLAFLPEERSSYPQWTKLSYKQCPHCPLKEEVHPRCPIASNLSTVIEAFRNEISTVRADIEISSETRTYKKNDLIANGVSSLFGLIMVTSGCPVMDKLKPMVRTHTPFATIKETVYRLVANYMLGQYFRAKKGLEPDMRLDGLVADLEDFHKVNQSFCDRIAETCAMDAGLNAIVHLDCFADTSAFIIKDTHLQQMEQTFSAY